MNVLAVVLVLLLLVCAVALWRHRTVRRRQDALIHLLRGADDMEQLLTRAKQRMRTMDSVVGRRIPADLGAEARASLRQDQQVDEGLRELLQHRLWIQRHGDSASQAELDEACNALDRARDRISVELTRLERAGAELDEATEAAIAAARREPPELRRSTR
ncbi:MAG: hypothetical protein ACXIUZ_01035 [Lysobacteraceae bacterium]